MPSEGVHRRAERRKYTIVVLPAAETGKTRRFRVGRFGLIAFAAGGIFLIAGLMLGALVYTPLGMYVPIPNPRLENAFGNQVLSIQQRLEQLTEEIIYLREYNTRLRSVLGERMSPADSALVVEHAVEPPAERSVVARAPERVEDFESGLDLGTAVSGIFRPVQVELPLMMPASGYITQEFDADRQHFGMDIAGREGSVIYAAADGRVIFSGWTYEDGYTIMLAHGSGYRTVYKHNQTLLTTMGASVRRGEPIALLGNSGRTSMGPHLHFELWKDAVPQNPRHFLLVTP